MKVAKVSEWMNPSKGKAQWYVTLDDGTETVCYSEKAKDFKPGDDIPEGWTVEAPKQEGWKAMLRAPMEKRGPGGGGYKGRSVEDQLLIDAHQQERMDRRTALMQAVTLQDAGNYLAIAEAMYKWLRETAPEGKVGATGSPRANDGGAGSTLSPLPAPPSQPSPDEVFQGTASGDKQEGVETSVSGEGRDSTPSCPPHDYVTPPSGNTRIKVCTKCGGVQKQ